MVFGAILGKMVDDMRIHWEKAFGGGELRAIARALRSALREEREQQRDG